MYIYRRIPESISLFSLFHDASYNTSKQYPRNVGSVGNNTIINLLPDVNRLEAIRYCNRRILYANAFSLSISISLFYSNEEIYGVYLFSHHFLTTLSTAVSIFTQHFLSFQFRNTFLENISASRIVCNRNVLKEI